MLPRDKGVIIQVGSALAHRSLPLQAAYCGAKHAMMGFTESLWSELLHDGSRVRVTVVQLPAVNTPQFEWAKTRMPKQPQPVPPIYQPEVIADAIVWVADHSRREVSVGFSTVKAILGEKAIPKLLDHYLAWTAYPGQQTDEPVDPNRPNNLFESVPGDYGSRGRFDRRARGSSAQFWLNKNRGWVTLAGVGAFAGLVWSQSRRAA